MINHKPLSTLVGEYDNFSSAKGNLPTPVRQNIAGSDYDVYSIPANFVDNKNFYGLELEFSLPTADRPLIRVTLNYTDKGGTNHSYNQVTIQTSNAPAGSPVNVSSSVWMGQYADSASLLESIGTFESTIINETITSYGNTTVERIVPFENTTYKIYFPVILQLPPPLVGPESELNQVSLYSGNLAI